MFSFYEAVVPTVQQPVQQSSGAVVPKAQPQQQSQPAQVPAQPAPTAQQPVANAGQTSEVQSAQTQSIQPVEPTWKKYLKNAAWVGAGLGLGGLAYAGATHWDDIKSHLLPGASVPTPDGETAENDNTNAVAVGRQRSISHDTAHSVPRSVRVSVQNEGPPPLAHQWGASGRIGNGGGLYVNHRPANQSQPNSYHGDYGSNEPSNFWWGMNQPSRASGVLSTKPGSAYNGRYHRSFSEDDFGLKSGMGN